MSSHLPVPESVPLNCGMTEGKANNFRAGTTVGTVQAGVSWHVALQTGLLDVLCCSLKKFFSVHHRKNLAYPSWSVAFLSLEKQGENNQLKVLEKSLA